MCITSMLKYPFGFVQIVQVLLFMLVLEIWANLVCLDVGQALKEGLICALNKEYLMFLFLVNLYLNYVLPLRIYAIIRDIRHLVNFV